MSKEPAEIFERAAEEGFITQVGRKYQARNVAHRVLDLQLKHHSTVSQYGQLSGALKLDGSAVRAHFKEILYNQVLNGKFCKEFSQIEGDLEKQDASNPLEQLYAEHGKSELGQAEQRVRGRLAGLL